jgi:hypothetical protein
MFLGHFALVSPPSSFKMDAPGDENQLLFYGLKGCLGIYLESMDITAILHIELHWVDSLIDN